MSLCGRQSNSYITLEILRYFSQIIQMTYNTRQKIESCNIKRRKQLLTNLLNPWSRSIIKKLIVSQLAKHFPAFYETENFITAFTTAGQLLISWPILVQFMLSHPTSYKPILTLASHLRLDRPSFLLPSDFPTKTLHALLLSPILNSQKTQIAPFEALTNYGTGWRWEKLLREKRK